MGLFDKLREPVVLKEDSSAKKQLEQLDFYSKLAPESVKEQIEQDKKTCLLWHKRRRGIDV